MSKFTVCGITLAAISYIMFSAIPGIETKNNGLNSPNFMSDISSIPRNSAATPPAIKYVDEPGSAQIADRITLDIDDITDSPDCPKGSGWCGEDSIEMATAYFGAYVPQKYINKIANPIHPDLYSNDIPVSLDKLRLDTDYPDPLLDINGFKDWIKSSLIKSQPVVLGVKLKDGGNPLWNLDHFVLAVGFDRNSIIFNSNNFGGGTMSGSLVDISEPLTLVNSFNKYYGIAVKGFNFKDNSLPIKLKIKNEYAQTHMAEVDVSCTASDASKNYTVVKYTADQNIPYLDLNNMISESKVTFTGQKSFSFSDVIDINKITIYRCYLAD